MHAVTALWHVCHLAPFVAFVVSVCSGRYFCMSKKFKFYVSFYVSEHCSQTCLIHDITTDVPSIITSSNSCSIRCAPDLVQHDVHLTWYNHPWPTVLFLFLQVLWEM